MNNVTFGDGNSGYYETVAGGAGAVSINKVSSKLSIIRFLHKLSSVLWLAVEKRSAIFNHMEFSYHGHSQNDLQDIIFV